MYYGQCLKLYIKSRLLLQPFQIITLNHYPIHTTPALYPIQPSSITSKPQNEVHNPPHRRPGCSHPSHRRTQLHGREKLLRSKSHPPRQVVLFLRPQSRLTFKYLRHFQGGHTMTSTSRASSRTMWTTTSLFVWNPCLGVFSRRGFVTLAWMLPTGGTIDASDEYVSGLGGSLDWETMSCMARESCCLRNEWQVG